MRRGEGVGPAAVRGVGPSPTHVKTTKIRPVKYGPYFVKSKLCTKYGAVFCKNPRMM